MENKSNSYNYVKTKQVESNTQIELNSLEDLIHLMEWNNLRTVFVRIDQEEVAEYILMHKGGLIRQPSLGFQTLEDYRLAMKHRFPDSATYYMAHKLGFSRYEDFEKAGKAGVEERSRFDDLKNRGYLEGYPIFVQLCTDLQNEDLPARITNASQLNEWATENQFTDFNHLKEALEKGFYHGGEYAIGKEKGYLTGADYKAGLAGYFVNGEEYYSAREKGIQNRDELKRYIDFLSQTPKNETLDVGVLLNILSKLPQEKKVSIAKLYAHFMAVMADPLNNGEPGLPGWFSTRIQTVDDLVSVLTNKELVLPFGEYDLDGEYFETHKIENRHVVIDGSNVAYNSKGDKNKKPRLENLILLVTFLQEKGFEEIAIISDASLRHAVEDKVNQDALEEMANYMEAPAKTSADQYLIHYVRHHHCLLITNDTFREWKIRDKWVAENIDFYRNSFMIEGKTVMIPDLTK